MPEELFDFSKLGEEFFFGLKLWRVDAPSATAKSYGVLEMEHLVIDDVLDRRPRHAGMVEDTAHHNGVMGGIIVAQMIAGTFAAPGHPGTCQQSVKETGVKVIKDSLQIVGMTLGGIKALSSAHLADKVGLLADVVAGNVAAITGGSFAIDRTPVHLGQENVGDGLQYGRGRAFEEIGKANKQSAFAHADRVLDAGESEEINS